MAHEDQQSIKLLERQHALAADPVLEATEIRVGPKYTTSGFAKTATVAESFGNLVTFVEELAGPKV